MDYQNADKSRKIKTLIVGGIAAAIVLILGIWVIVAVVNNVNSKKATNNPVAVATPTTTTSTAPATTETSPSNQYKPQEETKPVETPAPAPVVSVNNVPETGPSDIALTALLMGVATTLLLTNYNLSKKNA